ncbi:hypothetical protein SAMN04488125_10168 [Methylorubrum salsuginis]|uniref:Uncharacterized protein n=2 Tax=Methylorubrum salsuginis TaxID=414703 RepID=A0A1I3Y6L7_9HYPH|nr:hypothetical protein SAMN04488125_10168 [Methylorubrum salsuginis]
MLSKKIHFSGKKIKKIAVSVSGQLRGYRSAFATWKMLNDNSGIELDFFVHTWKKIGVNLPTEHNANRCFEDRLARAYASVARERGTPYLHEKFANLTSFFRNSNFADDAELRDFYDAKIVVIEPDEDFEGKSNSWKMYYKIKEGFRIASGYDDYDAYIRIRPDRAITSLEKNAIFDMAEASRLSQDIFTEMAASYFASLPDLAIGDQFALGDPWAMKRYCDAFDLVTQKSENPELIGMYYELVPHCTVAGAALLQGVLPRAALGMRFGSFLNADRIRPDLALELIECDLASGADDEGQALLRAARADVKA